VLVRLGDGVVAIDDEPQLRTTRRGVGGQLGPQSAALRRTLRDRHLLLVEESLLLPDVEVERHLHLRDVRRAHVLEDVGDGAHALRLEARGRRGATHVQLRAR